MKISTLVSVFASLVAGRYEVRRCRSCSNRSIFVGISRADESWVCVICKSNRRYELMAIALRQIFPRLPAGAIVVETDHRSPLRNLISTLSSSCRYIRTAYIQDSPMGCVLRDPRFEGAQNEDLTRLSFSDESVHLIVACDVLEHIERLESALSEISRVLAKDGYFLFTVPLSTVRREQGGAIFTTLNGSPTYRKAWTANGTISFIGEPEFHLDPNSDDGIAAYWSFGPDVCAFLKGLSNFEVREIVGPEGPDMRAVYCATLRK